MSIAKQYTKEIVQALQYLPIWLPIKKLELGSIGTIKNHVFEITGNIKNTPLPFSRSLDRPSGTMRYSSKKGVSLQAKLAGSAPAVGSAFTTADAGVSVKFSRGEVVVFEASGCKIESIADVGTLGQSIVRLYKMGTWDPDQYVVTEVVRADAATVLISSNAGASIELRVGGKVDVAGVSLADVNAEFGVAGYSDMGYQIVAERGLTPLFKAYRVDPGFFNDTFEPAQLESDALDKKKSVTNIPVFSQMGVADFWPPDEGTD